MKKLSIFLAALALSSMTGAALASQPIYPGYTGSNHPASCSLDAHMVPGPTCNQSGGSTRGN